MIIAVPLDENKGANSNISPNFALAQFFGIVNLEAGGK